MGEQGFVDRIEGVSLAEYAAVVAASAEGHPLAEAQVWAGVAAETWRAVAAAWRKTLAESPAALSAHLAELAKAEERLHRRVPPIEDDAAAWVAFMTCVEQAPDVIPLLAQADLGPNDVSRLTRAWTGRLAKDADLKKRLGDLRARQKTGVMPAVRPEPRVPIAPTAAPDPAHAAADAAPDRDERALLAHATARRLPRPSFALTADLDAHGTPSPPLPFTPKPVAPTSGETKDVSDLAEAVPALPFSPSGAAAAPVVAPAAKARVVGGGATMDLSDLFSGDLPEEPPSLPFKPRFPAPGAGLTLDLTPPSDPEPPSPPARAPDFSMERYASLSVELSLGPAHAADVLGRYHLDEAQRAALDALWAGRFAASPPARAAFDGACATYRAWLLARTR